MSKFSYGDMVLISGGSRNEFAGKTGMFEFYATPAMFNGSNEFVSVGVGDSATYVHVNDLTLLLEGNMVHVTSLLDSFFLEYSVGVEQIDVIGKDFDARISWDDVAGVYIIRKVCTETGMVLDSTYMDSPQESVVEAIVYSRSTK